ncbi:uncharacterized protein MONBRDRAFT_9625 [Monosiga brevicollis MX1]|uniref:Uncharacterized protein n=1 Tax=Monosiga brevicollis TaxID=81824 RepID=A9V3W4_MONBE|nr:uncharacterized protein MONBRDRAFT_9625 [Monosiga brevicollis MX1]EDQ87875.1 predicted protein [Monosiga brevicollis MX1]|eukprot:XP_001747408.1 hypothetical protein [Monosiga brevicollis MX1]
MSRVGAVLGLSGNRPCFPREPGFEAMNGMLKDANAHSLGVKVAAQAAWSITPTLVEVLDGRSTKRTGVVIFHPGIQAIFVKIVPACQAQSLCLSGWTMGPKRIGTLRWGPQTNLNSVHLPDPRSNTCRRDPNSSSSSSSSSSECSDPATPIPASRRQSNATDRERE